MAHYRIMLADYTSDEDSAEVVEAASPEEAVAKFAEENDYSPDELEAKEYLSTMQSECVCGPDRAFTNTEHPKYPGAWKCDGCGDEYGLPPDQINWRWEDMFASGYVPCHCEGYNDRCVCGGAGWVRPELLEDVRDYECDYDCLEGEY